LWRNNAIYPNYEVKTFSFKKYVLALTTKKAKKQWQPVASIAVTQIVVSKYHYQQKKPTPLKE
jgi:hypothetical protein